MVLKTTIQSQDQVQQEAQEASAMKGEFIKNIQDSEVFKTLGLPEEPQDEVQQEEASQDVQEPQQNEVQSEQQDQEVQQEESESQGEGDIEEEVIPKSKVQPRIDKLVGTIKQLQEEINALKTQATPPKNDIDSQIDAMNDDQLSETLKNIYVKKMEVMGDKDALMKLADLEVKIQKAMMSAPQRETSKFTTAQNSSYMKAVNEIQSIEEIPQTPEVAESIKGYAKTIYESNPSLQKNPEFMGHCLLMGAKHFLEISKLRETSGRTDVNKLKSQVNTLKRKTNLDTKIVKGTVNQVANENLRKRAFGGTLNDKANWIKSDPRFNVESMIPDDLRKG